MVKAPPSISPDESRPDMTTATKCSTPPILIVEDSPEDYEATARTFRKASVTNSLFWCKDGDEALDYLFRRGRYADPDDAPRPGVILLNLNLPGTDGREVLAEIKRDQMLKRIPVIVLTTSVDDRDIQDCYEAGANTYVQKPVDLASFIESIQRLEDFWWQIVLLPKGEAA